MLQLTQRSGYQTKVLGTLLEHIDNLCFYVLESSFKPQLGVSQIHSASAQHFSFMCQLTYRSQRDNKSFQPDIECNAMEQFVTVLVHRDREEYVNS